MSKSILSIIIGLGGEDVTTEVLSYILTNERYDKIQSKLLERVLLISKPNKLDFQTQTQKTFKEGRPDIVIEGNDIITLIENKFYANFSNDDQITRYIEILENNYNDYSVRKLIVLTVRNRSSYLMKEIKRQLNTNNIETKFAEYNIVFSMIYWEDILEVIKNFDQITFELDNFIYENYIRETIINEHEKIMINNNEIPQLLEKVWNSIIFSRDYLMEYGFSTSRMSQSRTTLLYYVEFSWGRVCIQLFIHFWKKYNSPFVVQIMNDWKTKRKDISSLVSIGFTRDEEYDYIYPIPIDGDDLSQELNLKLFEVLKRIRDKYGA